MMPLIIGFVLLLILLACSALISGSEVAFFSLSPAEIEEIENKEEKTSKLTISLLDRPKDLLAIILITNNFINVGIIVLSTFLSGLLFPPESMSPLSKFLIDVIAITFLLLLFGEVIPKIYATKHGKQMSLLMAKPLHFIGKIPPFSWLKIFLVKGTSVISNLGKKKSLKISSDELNHAVELTIGEEGDEKEKKIWKDIVKFGEKDVKQIMRGRVDVEGIDSAMNFQELYLKVGESRYSRIPVYEESFDNIQGILYVKDLLPYLDESESFDWQSLIREPYFVPENKKIDDLMNNFQEMKMHMAIVVDEYGGKSGVVTLEDVLEEIVGDIADEFDEDELFYSKLDEFNYVFEGKTPLVDIYKVLGIEGLEFEEAKSESDTLAGFVIEQAGTILKKGERIQFSNFEFQIEAADARKIKRIKITLQEKKENDE